MPDSPATTDRTAPGAVPGETRRELTDAQGWHPGPPPKDGRRFYMLTYRLLKWTPYKPDGQRQMRAKGRWQEAGEYAGWENCSAKDLDGPWIAAGSTVPDGLALITAAPDLFAALYKLLDHYVSLVNSGDAGFWNPEEEDEVIAARRAISRATEQGAGDAGRDGEEG